jgi:nicotinamidase-related amidase
MDEHTRPDFSACALLSIDLQADFAEGGPLEVPGTLAAARALGPVLEAFRTAGRLVVHVVRLYEPGGCDADLPRRGRVLAGKRLVAPESEGARILAPVRPPVEPDHAVLLSGQPQHVSEDEIIVYKPRWGAFHRTPLEDVLQSRGVSTVCVAGTSFANCVRATVYEASSRDFRVVAVREAVAGMDEAGCAWLAGLGGVCLPAGEVARRVRGEANAAP